MGIKKHIALFYGGRSAEHSVSIKSARNVYDSCDSSRYQVNLIWVDQQGQWFLSDSKKLFTDHQDQNLFTERVTLFADQKKVKLLRISDYQSLCCVDIVFPVLHGPYGEDGSIQGFARSLNVACVGSGVLGSAICMDKEITKNLIEQAGINTAPFICHKQGQKIDRKIYEKIEKILGYPVYVKPANMGSSVGVSKVCSETKLEAAIKDALNFDSKILIEQEIVGKEIECAVLGNENPSVSVAGEVITKGRFYSYQNKYHNQGKTQLNIPANLEPKVLQELQALSLKVFKILQVQGMARIDFFVTDENIIYINEVNTIPGFTQISMYPKLWNESGVSYTELVTNLLELAVKSHEKLCGLRLDFNKE